ncbi:hypothetical protein EV361DRAFT_247419 [Lentinula raphanica]|uniref:Mid2 domain-containing protein n=1 Tax=Lentinula raphanica TaxID=153919 RepID=A0AA38PKF5_9AGAR|nr:hypothetical protein F5878DRAFT_138121 [Lentinula raphanica]KAJ3976667.1 hypothetical protein EV361DRAFT_247419 [Lentinula raphanica]
MALFLLFRIAFFMIFIGQTLAQSVTQSITLWLFGAHRLDSGPSTLPLQPMGTPSDGLSTTYLYELVQPITGIVDVDGSPEPSFSIVASRTVVASASGWVEHFGTTDTIQCNFFSSESASGICSDITRTDTGTPTPVVLAVSTPVVTTSKPAYTTSITTIQTLQPLGPTISPTNSVHTTTPTPSDNLSVGAIIGVTIAGTLAVCLLGVLVLCLFRRRQRYLTGADQAQRMEAVEPYQSFPYDSQVIPNAPRHPPPYSSTKAQRR